MKILSIDRFGLYELFESKSIPGVGDKVVLFSKPCRVVQAVLLWPYKDDIPSEWWGYDIRAIVAVK